MDTNSQERRVWVMGVYCSRCVPRDCVLELQHQGSATLEEGHCPRCRQTLSERNRGYIAKTPLDPGMLSP